MIPLTNRRREQKWIIGEISASQGLGYLHRITASIVVLMDLVFAISRV
jgi:hypothetical protein